MAKILVIERDGLIREILHEVLEQSGYTVNEASDCVHGLELFHKEPADLIVYHLSDCDDDSIGSIKRLREEFPAVKIITMADGAAGSLSRAGLMDAVHTLAKPFRPQELMRKIREMIMPETASAKLT